LSSAASVLPDSLQDEVERRSWRLPSEYREDFRSLAVLEVLERQRELGRQLTPKEVRTAVDTCRKRLLRDLKKLREEQPFSYAAVEDTNEPQVESSELLDVVMGALRDFSDQDVELFHRVFVEERSYNELARTMLVNENALRQRVFRMRRALRERFPEE